MAKINIICFSTSWLGQSGLCVSLCYISTAVHWVRALHNWVHQPRNVESNVVLTTRFIRCPVMDCPFLSLVQLITCTLELRKCVCSYLYIDPYDSEEGLCLHDTIKPWPVAQSLSPLSRMPKPHARVSVNVVLSAYNTFSHDEVQSSSSTGLHPYSSVNPLALAAGSSLPFP